MEVLVDKYEINDQDFLWKYLDFYKFLYLIEENKIYFSRIDQFDDPLEGLTDRIIFDLWICNHTPDFEIMNPALPLDKRQQIAENAKRGLSNIKEVAMTTQRTQFSSCWYLSKRESRAMWDLYSDLGSVAIRFGAKELIELMKDQAKEVTDKNFNHMTIGNVYYRDLYPPELDPNKPSELPNSFSINKKDSSYSHENEFRFVINFEKVIPDNIGFGLKFPQLSSLNFNIITHPKTEKWKFMILKKLLSKYNLEKNLSKSNILAGKLI
jgi:hypothetical protein